MKNLFNPANLEKKVSQEMITRGGSPLTGDESDTHTKYLC
jgi:hypothetical protein